MSFRNRGTMSKGYTEKGFEDHHKPTNSPNDIEKPIHVQSKVKETAVEYILRKANEGRFYEGTRLLKNKKHKLDDFIKSVFNQILRLFKKERQVNVDSEIKSREEIAIENAKRMYAERKNIPKFKSKRRTQNS